MKKKWVSIIVALSALAAGTGLGGCGSGSGSDDDESDDCSSSCGSGSDTDPTLNLTGRWLADSSFRYQDHDSEGSIDVPDAARTEVFLLTNGFGTPEISTCRDGGETTNVVREGDDTLSFDFNGVHYELDITDADSMTGSLEGEVDCDNCTHTETESGTVTLRRIRGDYGTIGTIDYQLNGEMNSADVTCFSDERYQGTYQDVSEGAIEARSESLHMGLVSQINPAQTGHFRGEHARPLADATRGWREFGLRLPNGLEFEAEAENVEGNLQFAYTATYTDDGVTISVNSAGTGTDATGDEFVFEFSGIAELDLTSADASSDASSDAP